MIAVDTSLVVALFASWHEAHASAREAVPAEVHLPAHVLLESYSVLARLPPATSCPCGHRGVVPATAVSGKASDSSG